MGKPKTDGANGTERRGTLYEEITARIVSRTLNGVCPLGAALGRAIDLETTARIVADLERGMVPWGQLRSTGRARPRLAEQFFVQQSFASLFGGR